MANETSSLLSQASPVSNHAHHEMLKADDVKEVERRLKLKVDFRLCTIAGMLCSLNLLDSGIISSASVTSMLEDLQLDEGNRYSIAILIFTVTSIVFHLPATIAVRLVGPRTFCSAITVGFGLVTISTAFIRTWRQMILMRVLLGFFMSGIYPGLGLLISSWYKREELQLRFAFLQAGQLLVLATGGILNSGLNHLGTEGSLKGWQYMYVVQGTIASLIGIITYWWVVDFPEHSSSSFWFLNEEETKLAVSRIQNDRDDVHPKRFSWEGILRQFLDLKIYGFAVMFFLQNLVSTALSYFLPIILKDGMGFKNPILLSALPYYYAIIPVVITSRLGDKYGIRGPIITLNCCCLIAGFALLGFADGATVRYVGTFLATGAYVSNWAALNGYQASNIVGQWKRAVTAASVTACNGLGGVAGAFIVRQPEAPRFLTAIWVSMGSHLIIIGVVLVFSTYFMMANRRQSKGKILLEGEGFRYTY